MAAVTRDGPEGVGEGSLTSGIAQYRDFDGFTRLDRVITADPTIIEANAQPAKARIAVILAGKGGRLADITVGDCVEFYDVHSRIRPQGGPGKKLFYVLLHRLGIFGPDAPTTLRALCGPAKGQALRAGTRRPPPPRTRPDP